MSRALTLKFMLAAEKAPGYVQRAKNRITLQRTVFNEGGEWMNEIELSRIENLEGKLNRIRSWCDAYPLAVFPEPDLQVARMLLEAGGMTLDAVSASSMRHVLKGIKEIIDEEITD